MAGVFMRGFDTDCKGQRLRWLSLAAGLAVTLTPLAAQADGMIDSGAVHSWLDMVTASQNAQPRWMTPLVTVTPRLEQELRWDVYDQQNGAGTQGNSQRLLSDGGPGGPRVEFIPTYDTEVILAAPPIISASGPKGTQTSAGDWPAFLVKYRFISANEQNGNYIVTGFFQMSVPSGYGAGISNNVLVAQPTLAFGKGWGDFDIQSTLSVQVPVDSYHCLPAGPTLCTAVPKTGTFVGNFGDPFLWNTTFQYHLWEYFWPELEVNYTYWPNGTHAGWNQVLLTPGLILGRFKMAERQNLIIGAGYQMAVTNNPVTQNNFVATVRFTF
jgi:hypothetical protein